MNKDNKNTEVDNTDKKLHMSDVISSKNYTTDEVKQLIKHFVKTADFIDFNREYGITGWNKMLNNFYYL